MKKREFKNIIIAVVAIFTMVSTTSCKKDSSTNGTLVKTFTNIKIGWTDNTNLPKAINLTTGELYTVANASMHSADIDLIGRDAAQFPDLCAPSGDWSNNIAESQRWTTRKGTMITLVSSITAAQYNDVKTNTELETLIKQTNTPSWAEAYLDFGKEGKAWAFKTFEGKYGIILYKSWNGNHASANSYIIFDYKIQQ